MIDFAEPRDDSPNKVAALRATIGLRGRRVILPTVDALVDRMASDLVSIAHRRAGAAGVFHLALSGGSTPQALYQRMIIDPRYRAFPWSRTHLWLVDDRCVDFDDERSNFKMVRELIVDHVDMDEDHVHPMRALEAGGDRHYEEQLHRALHDEGVGGRMDMVLLGMGADAHTASLFPATPALDEQERWVVFNDGESVAAPRPRMTMTYPLINGARNIAVLVTGVTKHPTIQHVSAIGHAERTRDHIQKMPVTGVIPTHEATDMVWYLDEAAALGITPAE